MDTIDLKTSSRDLIRPQSRDQILRHARGQGNIIFPVQLTTSRIGNLTRLTHILLYVMTIHTYIHTVVVFFTLTDRASTIPSTMYVCMYVCMAITYSRVRINRVRLPILLVVSRTGKMNIPLSPCVPENLVSRDGFSRPVPRQPAHLHTQAESGAYLRDSSRVPRRRPFMNRHTPSGQSRAYRVTQLRTDGVHYRESAGTGPVNLKVVPNECCLGRSPWTN